MNNLLSVLNARLTRLTIAASEPEAGDLEYLIHDKGHVLKHGQRWKPLDIALKRHGRRAPVLWRGLDKYNIQQFNNKKVGDVIVTPSYWSFTENPEIAAEFASGYKTGVLLKLAAGAQGFSLWRWALDDLKALKRSNPEEYDDTDGDFLAINYKKESEWLLDIGSRLRITKITKGLIEVDYQK